MHRCKPGIAPAVRLAALALALSTATSLVAQDRCERYAHRAVEQYHLMQSHASCQVKPDLRWQDSYSNHLFACRNTPQLLTKAEDAARDHHLRTCGGLSADSASTTLSPTSGGVAPTTPTGPQPAPPAANPTAGPAASACKVDLPPSFALAYGTNGVDASVIDGVLRYEETRKHERQTFSVVRPTYYATQQRCGAVPATTSGPWLSRGLGGASDMYFLMSANKTVQAWPLRHALYEQLVAPQKP